MSASGYDKGIPTEVRLNADGSYAVPSHRGLDNEYTVWLDESPRCSCIHYTARLAGTGQECKHIASVRDALKRQQAADRARELTDEALVSYRERYAHSPIIHQALLAEQARRAEKRPIIGSSVKFYGPLDDEAAFRGGDNWAGEH